MRKRMLLIAAGCLLALGSGHAWAQEDEEDGDYRALMRKTTTNTNRSCIDYLNSEHGEYSGDKMKESRLPDEITKGLSRALRDECQKHPKERVDKAVSNVRNAYTAELSEVMRRMKDNNNALKSNGGA